MNTNLDRLLAEEGEAGGVKLAEALVKDNIDRLAYSISLLEREKMAANRDTAYIAARLNLQEDSEINEDAQLIFNLTFLPMRKRIERFVDHIAHEHGLRLLSFGKADMRRSLDALVKQDLEDLDF